MGGVWERKEKEKEEEKGGGGVGWWWEAGFMPTARPATSACPL